MAFGTTAGSAAAGRPPRLGPPRVLAFLFQWNDNPRPFVWTATVDSIQGEALAMSTNAGTDTTGLHFAAQKETESSVQLVLGATRVFTAASTEQFLRPCRPPEK